VNVGFLLGSGRRAIHPARSVGRAGAVRIDDRQHIEVRRWLRRLAPPLEIVGVYHSHPNGPARPSAADRAEAHYPDWVFAIVSLERGREDIGLFEIVRGRARRLRV
jgi:proteasome lid subunit RPN8/RPN11